MDSQQTLSHLLERLEYKASPNLITEDASGKEVPAELEVTWRDAKEKLKIDAIYFVSDAPIIYFKQFESFDLQKIAQLHQNVWNQSLVPLIFVVLPNNDIRVYNGYKVPRRSENGLDEPSRLDNELQPQHSSPVYSLWESSTQEASEGIWERLSVFTRSAIDSGSFWRDYGEQFDRETRADQKLIANLRYVRQELTKELHVEYAEYAHNLIGRSIFALYLQDRGVLPRGESGFFAEEFQGKQYTCYTDLLASHSDTYIFFQILRKQFNGDMFPVTDEEKECVRPEHLATLRRLFTEDVTQGGQLLFFWAYNFEFIPIELISSIYEEFLHQEESGKDGAYYTPPMLVDFMLNQVLSRNDSNYESRFLDPACGSGIFLVEAYRRLVERWISKNGHPSPEELAYILKKSIFGVDIKRQALRVAAFSLYLAMLDYVEPKNIWMNVHFPPLIGTNLIAADFFEEQVNFEGIKFDFIVGNPPWVSKLTSHAKVFLRKRGYKYGDEQIVQAFLWHAPDFCAKNGQIALLCSSKSLLFNKSYPNVAFRRDFFRKFRVKKVFDFSALRRYLFPKGIAPVAAIFYNSQEPDIRSTIFYGAPKLTYLARRFAAIVIETSDLKQIPLRQVLESIDSMSTANNNKNAHVAVQATMFDDDNDDEIYNTAINIWKVALWGTDYDYILLQAFNNYPSLLEVIGRRNWHSGSGFIRSGTDEPQYCHWLDNALFLDAKYFTRYGIDTSRLITLPENALYHRGRKSNIFHAPLVLFKRGQFQRRPGAAYSDLNFTYTDAITGITGPEQDRDLLKALAALLNSEFMQYYLFLTSASWGVEREEIKAGEMRNIPFPFLDLSKDQLSAIATLVDILALHTITQSNRIVGKRHKRPEERDSILDNLEEKLNNYIFSCFHLNKQEILHIRETVRYAIGFFNSPDRSLAVQRPPIEMLKAFAEAYIQTINLYLKPVGKKLTAMLYIDEKAALYTIQFSSKYLHEDILDITSALPDSHMRQALAGLRDLSSERVLQKLYHRRNFRIYNKDNDTLYLVKPPEQRLWTVTAALNDAEETVSELTQPLQV